MAERAIDREAERPQAVSAAVGPLIGRDADLQFLVALLSDQHARLVTLIGPGGVGKTQLALHVAEVCAEAYPDGVIVLSFAHVRDPETVLTIIASAVRSDRCAEMAPRQPLAGILRSTQERRMLLILDNLEHVADCAPFLSSLLAYAPNLTILTTSRETLGISGEYVFAVSPLDLPPTSRQNSLTIVEIMGSPAIQLFLTRALDHGSSPGEDIASLAPTLALGAMLTRVCRALDGIPLAIELVAARMRADTAANLEQQLTETLRDRPSSYVARDPLSHGMGQAVQWSYDLLTPEEQQFFRAYFRVRRRSPPRRGFRGGAGPHGRQGSRPGLIVDRQESPLDSDRPCTPDPDRHARTPSGLRARSPRPAW